MRKIRGGKNREQGLAINMMVQVQEDWLTYLVIFICCLMGFLFGYLIGEISSSLIILCVVVFLAIITAGLLVAWVINRKDQLLQIHLQQESLKQQYNAFVMLIGELEYNLSLDNGQLVCNEAWQSLRHEWAFFPPHIYKELDHIYRRFSELGNLENIEYRQVVHEELGLPTLISKIRDWQQKIRRQLPYVQ